MTLLLLLKATAAALGAAASPVTQAGFVHPMLTAQAGAAASSDPATIVDLRYVFLIRPSASGTLAAS